MQYRASVVVALSLLFGGVSVWAQSDLEAERRQVLKNVAAAQQRQLARTERFYTALVAIAVTLPVLSVGVWLYSRRYSGKRPRRGASHLSSPDFRKS